MSSTNGPLQVRLTRGGNEESRHLVHAVVSAPDGVIEIWGEGSMPVQPRSAIKYLQALPLLTTGAVERFEVTDVELALACASHSAEPDHIDAVGAWLRRIGLDDGALECGPDQPLGDAARVEFHRSGRAPAPILNCCSGKHAGFLTVARTVEPDGVASGRAHRGYIEPDHPVQRLVTSTIEAVTGVDTSRRRPGRDGCGIPVHPIELDALAGGMARLVTGDGLAPDLAGACHRLTAATVGKAWWVAGTGRHEVRLESWLPEPILSKTGAEGVFVAALPERGIGIALKAADGATRAAEIAISALLARFGLLDPARARRQLRNKAGRPVGWMEPVLP